MGFLINHLLSLSVMTVLLCCSAFFSGTETALFSLTREQVKRLRNQGHHVERLLVLLVDNPAGLLVAILFGNLTVNILFFSTSAVLAIGIGQAYGDGWQAVLGFVVLLIVIIAGEVLPKAIAMSMPERVVRLNSLPLRIWFHSLGPIRIALEAITRKMETKGQVGQQIAPNELKMLVEATRHDPSFGLQEKAIVEDIVGLPEMRVRELMVPRVKQLFRRADSPAGEAIAEAAEQEVELIPVYDGDEDNVVGVVEVRDLFVDGNPARPIGIFSSPVKFVPETKRADEMLHEFLTEGWRMVCVVNEYGGLAGTISLEDLLEEVVGEFDAHESTAVEQLGETTYRLQGSLGIREWRHLFVGFVPDEAMRDMALDTISGLVVSVLKRLPAPGDIAKVGNLRFTVEQVRSNRIETVLLELNGAGEES